MDRYSDTEHVNVGVGKDMTVAELATLIADVIGYGGDVRWDASKPDGVPRKLLDCTRINRLGWYPRVRLPEGVKSTYAWYVESPTRRGGAS
jgi:GDP-L-fucose synthase